MRCVFRGVCVCVHDGCRCVRRKLCRLTVSVWPVNISQVVIREGAPLSLIRIHQRRLHVRLIRHVRELHLKNEKKDSSSDIWEKWGRHIWGKWVLGILLKKQNSISDIWEQWGRHIWGNWVLGIVLKKSI